MIALTGDVTLRVIRAEDPRVEVGTIRRFYRHGWHSWSPTGWVDPGLRVSPIPDEGRRLGHDDPAHAFDTRVGGSGVGAAVDAEGRVWLLGALGTDARVWPDGSTLAGSSRAGPIDWCVVDGSVEGVFAAYAAALGDRLGRRPNRRVRVWCSWYSYYENVSQDDLFEIIAAADGHDFDVIQVDDGWERGIGDWVANDRFPSGMPAIADAISASGRTPGLWLAPYIARADSQLVADRPELVLRDGDGSPVIAGVNWGGPYYSLDPTSEATAAFVTELVERVRSWGFAYLKLDFLYAAAFPGEHADPMPRELAYRHAAQTLRRAAGDDCYLLACGAPVIPSIGLFDGIRIGPDVAEIWEDPELTAMGDYSGRGARNAIVTTSERLWLRDVIDTDPDVVYFDRSAVELDETTLQALRDLATITGFIGTSDRLDELDEREAAALDSLLRDTPPVQRDTWLRWRVGDRVADFEWAQRQSRGSAS